MRSLLVCIALLLMQPVLHAQFPHTTTLEIRSGQQRPEITGIVQDQLGTLWLASDLGLLRTDGERVDVILRLESDRISALHAFDDVVLMALESGPVLRCNGYGCDTLIDAIGPEKVPVRDMLVDRVGRTWLATYGAGIHIVDGDKILTIGLDQGLRDEHVNGLAQLPNGNIVAATDQGLAICDGARVIHTLGEAEGAPDNLILCVTTTASGEIWAGTDRSGAFRWQHGIEGDPVLLDEDWNGGVIQRIEVQGDLVWLGTKEQGVIVHDLGKAGGRYRYLLDSADMVGIADLMIDQYGMVWWCSGNEILHRSDAAILFVEAHEGLDLRKATAVCTDPSGRIWFALGNTLHHHAAGFSEVDVIQNVPLKLDPRTPIVSLAAGSDGSIWAATFGGGVIRVPPQGLPQYFTGGVNENVLSVKAHGDEVWFATLQGLAQYTPSGGMRSFPLPFPGFLFDLLPLDDGSILVATDGNGVLLFDATRKKWDTVSNGEGTFYSVISDGEGKAWAAGPGTGICPIRHQVSDCIGKDLPSFSGDHYALAYFDDHVLAFGSMGVLAYDPRSGSVTDATARLGMKDVHAELNAVWSDDKGSLWLAGDHGLVRMRPGKWHFSDQLSTVITAFAEGSQVLPIGEEIMLPHDYDRIHIQFSGIHYVDPGAVLFEYHLEGPDDRRQTTRDREIFFTDLRPGEYQFKIRAFTTNTPSGGWIAVPFSIRPPFWARAWFILLSMVLLITIAYLLLRMRDSRIRERQRMEQEKVRFQLEALRSQVDPHFLFNSFNTLVDLIESNADLAVGHVEKLSLFFRNILQVRDKELITVEEELGLLSNYFALEQHRFGNAIAMQLDVSDEARDMFIVPLTLQMLVENAIKHNVATLQQPLHITIRSDGGDLVVRNPIQARLTAPRSMGFGLDSIRKRYNALIKRPITINAKEGRFTITIPLISHVP